jgi:hypothetical protein
MEVNTAEIRENGSATVGVGSTEAGRAGPDATRVSPTVVRGKGSDTVGVGSTEVGGKGSDTMGVGSTEVGGKGSDTMGVGSTAVGVKGSDSMGVGSTEVGGKGSDTMGVGSTETVLHDSDTGELCHTDHDQRDIAVAAGPQKVNISQSIEEKSNPRTYDAADSTPGGHQGELVNTVGIKDTDSPRVSGEDTSQQTFDNDGIRSSKSSIPPRETELAGVHLAQLDVKDTLLPKDNTAEKRPLDTKGSKPENNEHADGGRTVSPKPKTENKIGNTSARKGSVKQQRKSSLCTLL